MIRARHSSRAVAALVILPAALLGPGAIPAADAVQVNVVGVFPNKAVLQIDGAAPRTLSVGQTVEGVRLVAVERDTAILEIDGRRRALKLGQQHVSAAQAGSSRQQTVLAADPRGHFVVEGQINGGPVRMVVDTGATLVAIPAADADRLGIRYRGGQVAMMSTANGVAPAWRVRLESVRVGEITINNVDAVVMESSSMPVLLGMSFLNRTEMRREGQSMTLIKRF